VYLYIHILYIIYIYHNMTPVDYIAFICITMICIYIYILKWLIFVLCYVVIIKLYYIVLYIISCCIVLYYIVLLPGVRSVTFSPPGLGHSYRKYKYHSFPSDNTDSSDTGSSSSSGISSSGGRAAAPPPLHASSQYLHHQSMAVVNEYDW
jgi:uncharacterized membrane protein YgcG